MIKAKIDWLLRFWVVCVSVASFLVVSETFFTAWFISPDNTVVVAVNNYGERTIEMLVWFSAWTAVVIIVAEEVYSWIGKRQ